MKKGKIIVVSGPSGSGKTTIVRKLIEEIPSLCFSISATTRKQREGEIEGKDYYFMSEVVFKKKIEEKAFLEFENALGNYYGTLKEKVDEILLVGKHVIFDIEVHGAMSIKKVFGKQALIIFVKPPSIEELEERLRKRKTETEETIKRRLERAVYECGFSERYDSVVVNENLDDVVREVRGLILNFIEF